MTREDAVALLGGAPLAEEPAVWADLGCGEGTFTVALATLLPPGSVIHAIDRDRRALRSLPPRLGDVSIFTHALDFIADPWPVAGLSGILLANSLHFVPDPSEVLRACRDAQAAPAHVVVVEYDTEEANPWVPYPVSQRRLEALLDDTGLAQRRLLGSRSSRFRRADLYAVSAAGSAYRADGR